MRQRVSISGQSALLDAAVVAAVFGSVRLGPDLGLVVFLAARVPCKADAVGASSGPS
jgi:hypothetical protein